MKRIHYVLLRRVAYSKSFYVVFLILAAMGAKAGLSLRESTIPSAMPLYQIYYGVLNDKIMVFLLFPMFLLLNGAISDLFDHGKVLLKYKHVQIWWREKCIIIGIYAIIFALAINAVILGAIMLSGQLAELNVDFVYYLLFGMGMQVIGFLLLGIIYHLMVLLGANKHISLFSTVAIFALLQAGSSILQNGYPTLEGYMILLHKFPLGNYTFAVTDSLPILFLLFLFTTLYILGVMLAKGKDFYRSD